MPYAEYLKLLQASPEYQAADSELNAVWAKARKNLARDKFFSLRNDQRLWLKERDGLAAKLIAQNLPAGQAYARITRDRTASIEAFVNREDQSRQVARQESESLSATHQTTEQVAAANPGKQALLPTLKEARQSNQSAAKPSVDLCDTFSISTRLYYGHYVPRPFVTFNLNVKKARRISSLMVNNYEIRRIKRYSKDLPQWKRRSDRNLELNLYTDTILNDIAIVYNDGTMCKIDNINIQKDMTNPYN